MKSLVFLVAAFTIMLTGCGANNSIIGKWRSDCITNESASGLVDLEFTSDKITMNVTAYDSASCGTTSTGTVTLKGSYRQVDGNKIAIKAENQTEETQISYSIKDNILTMISPGSTKTPINFKRY